MKKIEKQKNDKVLKKINLRKLKMKKMTKFWKKMKKFWKKWKWKKWKWKKWQTFEKKLKNWKFF